MGWAASTSWKMGCIRCISFSWSSGQSHPLHNRCTGCTSRAQASSGFLAHHWKWGLSQDCDLREGDKENLVSQLKGFLSSDCLTCCFLYPRQSKSPKASICGSKTVLARRGHPVTLQVHGVSRFYHYYYYYYTLSNPSFAWAFAYSASTSI